MNERSFDKIDPHIRFWRSGQIALEAKERINKLRTSKPSYALAMAEEWIIKY